MWNVWVCHQCHRWEARRWGNHWPGSLNRTLGVPFNFYLTLISDWARGPVCVQLPSRHHRGQVRGAGGQVFSFLLELGRQVDYEILGWQVRGEANWRSRQGGDGPQEGAWNRLCLKIPENVQTVLQLRDVRCAPSFSLLAQLTSRQSSLACGDQRCGEAQFLLIFFNYSIVLSYTHILNYSWSVYQFPKCSAFSQKVCFSVPC